MANEKQVMLNADEISVTRNRKIDMDITSSHEYKLMESVFSSIQTTKETDELVKKVALQSVILAYARVLEILSGHELQSGRFPPNTAQCLAEGAANNPKKVHFNLNPDHEPAVSYVNFPDKTISFLISAPVVTANAGVVEPSQEFREQLLAAFGVPNEGGESTTFSQTEVKIDDNGGIWLQQSLADLLEVGLKDQFIRLSSPAETQ